MKHYLLLLLLLPSLLYAENSPTDSSRHHFTIGAGALYGYNHSLGHYGGGSISFDYAYHKYLNTRLTSEFHSPGYARIGLVATPILPIKHGEFFADVAVHSTIAWCNSINDFAAAISVGYRMDYLSVQLGVMTHCFMDMKGNSRIWEPVSALYNLGVECRPHSNSWNIGIGVANFNDYEYCRWYDPIFYLKSHALVYKNLDWNIRLDVKPAGNWDLSAQFWGITARTGLTYTF